ncbi:MAG: uncharacterized protein JWO82_3631 [Akkermansiaceae bacterium]|nr:uncharacterized protein [Akkermansiaceae bacterium]
MIHTNDTCIDVCNSLLRGELSAVETYDQALEKFTGSPENSILQAIRRDHQESVSTLRSHLADMGAKASDSSGIWGAFAKGVEGSAKVFGESAALSALIAGEKSGVSDYESALSDDEVMTEIKSAIRATLLPRLHEHVIELERLKA